MEKYILLLVLLFSLVALSRAEDKFQTDVIKTDSSDLAITFIGHGTLMFEFNNLVIHVDPVSRYADYDKLPKADLILVTHEHPDHLDPQTIEKLEKTGTEIFLTQTCYDMLKKGTVLKNGESGEFKGIRIDAVPAYNLVHKRDNGEFFHPKGVGNGYVVHLGDQRVYIAGDTENIPEMKNLAGVDVAFLPMNLPYTMTPEMAADAARMIIPKIFYPYHYGDSDVNALVQLLKNDKGIDIRVRNMK